MPLGMLSTSRAVNILGAQLIPLSFGQRLRIHAWDRGSSGRKTTMNEADTRRVRCPARKLGALGVLCDACLSFVSKGVRER